MDRLRDKVALVTGARRGIGKAIAARMAEEGAIVVSADIEPGHASSSREVVLDVRSEEAWTALAAEIRREFGRLDVLVNNAGIDIHKPAADTTLEEWRRVMAVNLDSMFLGCKALHSLLVEAGRRRPAGAAIVNISSTMGIGALPGNIAYGTSKAGVRHMSKLMAVEWAEPAHNIRVNSIHPGTTRTAMFDQAALGWARQANPDATLETGLAAIASMNPLQRLATVDDIAYAAIYLASDEASFVTGSELVVDGGYLAR